MACLASHLEHLWNYSVRDLLSRSVQLPNFNSVPRFHTIHKELWPNSNTVNSCRKSTNFRFQSGGEIYDEWLGTAYWIQRCYVIWKYVSQECRVTQGQSPKDWGTKTTLKNVKKCWQGFVLNTVKGTKCAYKKSTIEKVSICDGNASFPSFDVNATKSSLPAPGIEPGPAGWEPAILTTRPCRTLLLVIRFLNSYAHLFSPWKFQIVSLNHNSFHIQLLDH